jgi:uncharacterized membrane protein YhaH (DUF805 family)
MEGAVWDKVGLYLIAGVFALYGFFCMYVAYMIWKRHVFQYINGIDANVERRINNKKKFAAEFCIPYVLMALVCFVSSLGSIFFSWGAMGLFGVIPVFIIGQYISIIARRVHDRIRNGAYS